MYRAAASGSLIKATGWIPASFAAYKLSELGLGDVEIPTMRVAFMALEDHTAGTVTTNFFWHIFTYPAGYIVSICFSACL